MSKVRKTTASSPSQGVIELAKRRRQVDSGERAAEAVDEAGIRETAHGAIEGSLERAERIAELKAQIANGTYNPAPREVARKLLESGF